MRTPGEGTRPTAMEIVGRVPPRGAASLNSLSTPGEGTRPTAPWLVLNEPVLSSLVNAKTQRGADPSFIWSWCLCVLSEAGVSIPSATPSECGRCIGPDHNPDSDSIRIRPGNMPARPGLECRGSRTAALVARVGIGIGIGIGIESEFEFEFEYGDPAPGTGDEDVAAPFHPGAGSRCARLCAASMPLDVRE
jgi:hypothetical protein